MLKRNPMYSRILFISIFAEKIKKEGIKLILKYNTLIQHKHKVLFKSLIIFIILFTSWKLSVSDIPLLFLLFYVLHTEETNF